MKVAPVQAPKKLNVPGINTQIDELEAKQIEILERLPLWTETECFGDC